MSDEADVRAVIRNWHLAISSGDAATLKGVWDQDYDGLIYIAEENNEPLTDWPSINAYYDELLAAPVKWSIDDLQVGVEGEAAWAYLTFVAEGRVEALQHDFVWNGRNSFSCARAVVSGRSCSITSRCRGIDRMTPGVGFSKGSNAGNKTRPRA